MSKRFDVWCGSVGASAVAAVCSFLFAIGMSAWGIVIYSQFFGTLSNSATCQAKTILDLLLTYSIVTVISGLCSFGSIFMAVLDACVFQASQRKEDRQKSRPCYSIAQCCIGIIGCATLGLLIAMTVFQYANSCKTEQTKLYDMMHPYLITQYCAIPILGCLLGCFVCFVQCCIAMRSENTDYIRVENIMH
ncbi:hypothetical protein C9374_005931 [Naegleria lovaniensis]|uniref:Uncharacterized protein n=1 Tax=Naegleria lovaniensis TaxID=51637 RepID=A0AA88GNN5_NAELO|nr:uncharacterized protein C9374_005931 [Naegleria lovaniensis]KAG2381547.1 hypothetical protein C9374_005931 [Naegleria lovaniensis]